MAAWLLAASSRKLWRRSSSTAIWNSRRGLTWIWKLERRLRSKLPPSGVHVAARPSTGLPTATGGCLIPPPLPRARVNTSILPSNECFLVNDRPSPSSPPPAPPPAPLPAPPPAPSVPSVASPSAGTCASVLRRRPPIPLISASGRAMCSMIVPRRCGSGGLWLRRLNGSSLLAPLGRRAYSRATHALMRVTLTPSKIPTIIRKARLPMRASSDGGGVAGEGGGGGGRGYQRGKDGGGGGSKGGGASTNAMSTVGLLIDSTATPSAAVARAVSAARSAI